jgi:hypothetical protein
MYCVYNVPAEVWTLIFEYLNLEDLVDVESACTPLWGSTTQQVATSVISGIIAHGTLVAAATVDCPNLPDKQEQLHLKYGLKPAPSMFFPCQPLHLRSFSRAFRTADDMTQLTLQLDSRVGCNPRYQDPPDFHPCENGPEPIEVIGLSARFTSVHLPHDLGGTLKLTYSTIGKSICDQLYDVPLDQGIISRTISHRLSGLELEWNTEGMFDNEFVELPRKWVDGILQNEIDVMMRFEQSPALIHWRRVRGQVIECTPWALKDFKATWTFWSVPPSIARAVSHDSQQRLESDNLESQVGQTVHRGM